jgi:hypothetical protein
VRGIPRRFRYFAPRVLCPRDAAAYLGGLTKQRETGGLISAFCARFFAIFRLTLRAVSLTLRPLRCPPMLPIMNLRALTGMMCGVLPSPAFGAIYADR